MDATVTVGMEWRPVEAEGQVCWCCGDRAWLRAVGLFVVLQGGLGKAEGGRGPVVVLCQSCEELAEELRS